mgnify:CR=1
MHQDQSITSNVNAAERMSPSSQKPSECALLHDNQRGGGSHHFPQGQLSDPPADRHSQQPASPSISGAPVGVEEAMDDVVRESRVLSLGEALHHALNQGSELAVDVELNNCWETAVHRLIE